MQGFSFRLVSRTLNPSSKDLDDKFVHVTLQRFGMFVGAVSDNFDERIDQKIFHAEIVVDVAKVSAETKAYQPIPIIADFTDQNGSDSLRETIEANYRQVKQEVLSLVDSETARIKADPTLSHLIKE